MQSNEIQKLTAQIAVLEENLYFNSRSMATENEMMESRKLQSLMDLIREENRDLRSRLQIFCSSIDDSEEMRPDPIQTGVYSVISFRTLEAEKECVEDELRLVRQQLEESQQVQYYECLIDI